MQKTENNFHNKDNKGVRKVFKTMNSLLEKYSDEIPENPDASITGAKNHEGDLVMLVKGKAAVAAVLDYVRSSHFEKKVSDDGPCDCPICTGSPELSDALDALVNKLRSMK